MAYKASRGSKFRSVQSRHSPYKKRKASDENRKSSGSQSWLWNAMQAKETNWQPFKRNFYTESDVTKALSDPTVNEWMKEHAIESFAGYQDEIESKKANYKDVPKPIFEFEDAGFSKIVMDAIIRAGFTSPTPIQSTTWPMLSGGSNVIGIARTGSGKTLAFLLPAIAHISAQPRVKRGDGPIALFIAPTRELACQIAAEVEKFACELRYCSVYGGVSQSTQQNKLEQGVEIVIATPGRLLDLLGQGVTNFKRVTYCVIDEADRLLDMGFEPQLNVIMDQIRPDRQMCMFSATWPESVRKMARKHLVQNDDDSNVFQVAVGSFGKLQACEDVQQVIKFVNKIEGASSTKKLKNMCKSEKMQELKNAIDAQLRRNKKSKILVFVSTKRRTNKARDILVEAGYSATCMHGNKSQNARDTALKAFKNGKSKIMLATNVASRGIHVDDINLVINFDFPIIIEEYVHRIGRTGRAGNKGKAISFFVAEADGWMSDDLIKIMENTQQKIPKRLLQCRGMKKPKGKVPKHQRMHRNKKYVQGIRNRGGRKTSK